ncbi:PA2169 family four-helix-bundle protein [Arenimonas sp.]|uniref:PA2169 family four-helix-bundle protein n=1 Tax=Arenimonas sp. TaxID=1872635 RepID=UPI0025BC6549|nr:PA2169 family four-helix-bundle protein [Arenimonas sp.]
MNKTARSLNHLVEALNDGIDFHQHAAAESTHPGHRDLFLEMARIKSRIAADFKLEVAVQGSEPDQDGTWLGSVRQGYADLRAGMKKDSDDIYIAALEAQEDRVLEAFRDAQDKDQPDRVRELAARYLPEVREMHDRMRALKNAKVA